MGENAIPILESFGGLETDTERTSRTPGRASLCVNFRVGGQGRTLRKMAGASRHPSVQIVAGRNVTGFFVWSDRFGVTREVVRVEKSGYHSRVAGTNTWAQVQAVTGQEDGIPSFATANGKLFIVDGYAAYTWDGSGSGVSRFTTWNRLEGPTSSLVLPYSVTAGTPPADAPLAEAIDAVTEGSLAVDTNYEVAFVFGDSDNANRQSAPSPIMQVRTTTLKKTIRIDTGYAGRGITTSLPDTTTPFLHLPTDVALLNAKSRIVGLVSKGNTPGVWYARDASSVNIQTREIPIATTTAEAVSIGEVEVQMSDTMANLNWLEGDQVMLGVGTDNEEVVRIESVASDLATFVSPGPTLTHASGAPAVPLISLQLQSAGGADQYTEFYGPPVEATGIVSHFDALWTWGAPNFPTRIWFTDPDAPETFPTRNFIDVDPDNPNDPIMALVPFGKGFGAELLVLRLNSVWRLGGNSATTFLSQLVQTGPSCVGEHAAVALNDGTILWAGFEDVYRFDGSSVISLMKDRVLHDYRSSYGLVDVGGKLT